MWTDHSVTVIKATAVTVTATSRSSAGVASPAAEPTQQRVRTHRADLCGNRAECDVGGTALGLEEGGRGERCANRAALRGDGRSWWVNERRSHSNKVDAVLDNAIIIVIKYYEIPL